MPIVFAYGDEQHPVDIVEGDRVRVNGTTFRARSYGDGSVAIARQGADDRPPGLSRVAWVVYEIAGALAARRTRAAGHDALMAPMPATVRRINVAVGDAVNAGDTLIVLEAMKMELPIRAGVAGTVTALACREGELVQPGLALVEIEATPSP
jgi:biotin carboxyl carrier protein